MFLSQTTNNQRPALGRYALPLALSALILLLAAGAWGYWKKSSALPGNRIVCDAEKVRSGMFVYGKYRFEGGEYRTDERARSGRFAVCLPKTGQTVYALTYTLTGHLPGEAWRVSIWRFKEAIRAGKLVVQGSSPEGLYLEAGTAAFQSAGAWEKLEIFFIVPFHKPAKEIKIYVYSDGATPVCFDDLLIERVGRHGADVLVPEKLALNIGEQAMSTLSSVRDEALSQGILLAKDDSWVNARLGYDSVETSVKIRLKGDWLDHLHGDKWSFRVKMRPPAAWKQLQLFSLHTPAARHYLHEWLLHRLWEREDVLTTRYDFVELVQNGQSKGIYAWEEHFEKQLVESRQRREGPLLKLAEDGFWHAMGRQFSHHGYVRHGATHAPLDGEAAFAAAFSEEDWLANPAMTPLYELAVKSLEQWRRGMQPASEVFDIKRMARYYAICDVMGAYHGIVWHNQRFYFNPVTTRLEPVGFDGFGGGDVKPFSFLGEGALQPSHLPNESMAGALFQDTAFVRAYLAELHRLSSPAYWQTFVEEVQADWSIRMQWMQLEFPDYQASLPDFARHAAYIHSLLLPFSQNGLRAYRLADGRVQVQNMHTLPVEVVGYGGSGQQPSFKLQQPRWLVARSPRRLLDRLRRDSLVRQYADIRYLHEEAQLLQQATPFFDTLSMPASAKYVFYRLPGVDSLLAATPLQPLRQDVAVPGIRQQLQRQALPAADLPWLTERDGHWYIRRGRHVLNRKLLIPPGKGLLIEAGAELDLRQQACIISYAPVQAFGNEERPIRLFSSDGSGQGLHLIEAGGLSVFSHVLFSGLSNLQTAGWTLTGAVTCYESDVRIANCVFRENRSEDGLNIIRSNFYVENSLFALTSSDAFDADFCKGEVVSCTFRQTVNDGLDVSGSVVNVRNCRFENCGDKGMSVGEDSDATMQQATFSACNIAVAAKDLSTFTGRNLRLHDCRQGFVAYQKKPEFGPARLVIESFEASGVKKLHAIGPGSSLQLVDRLIDGDMLR